MAFKIYQHLPLQRHTKIYPNWNFRFENIPSGNPGLPAPLFNLFEHFDLGNESAAISLKRDHFKPFLSTAIRRKPPSLDSEEFTSTFKRWREILML
jgi:hypothetical protein